MDRLHSSTIDGKYIVNLTRALRNADDVAPDCTWLSVPDWKTWPVEAKSLCGVRYHQPDECLDRQELPGATLLVAKTPRFRAERDAFARTDCKYVE